MNHAEASRLFLGIISSVESGLMSPEDALREQTALNKEAGTKYNYRLQEFQVIRDSALSQPVEDGDPYEDSDDLFEDKDLEDEEDEDE